MAYEWENSTLEQKKAKLAELQAKLAQAKMDSEFKQQRGGLTRAAEAMMPYDPTGAFNLLDKREALDVKRLQAERGKGLQDVEEIRRQLRMNADRASRAAENTALSEAERKLYLKEAEVYRMETAKDNPSLQQAALDVNSLRKVGPKVTPVDGSTLTREGVWSEWKPKLDKLTYKDEVEDLRSTFVDAIVSLGDTDRDKLVGQFDALSNGKKNRPGAAKRPATTSTDIKASIQSALGALAAGSALSDLDLNSNVSRQILWKADQRSFSPEAVNEGDMTAGRSTLEKAIAKVTGVAPAITSSEASAYRSRAKATYDKMAATLRKYASDDPSSAYFKGVSAITRQNIIDALGTYQWKTLNANEAAGNPVLGAPTGGKTSGTSGKTTWRVIK